MNNPPRIYHAVAGIISNLRFYREDLNGVGYTIKLFLLPNLSLSAGSEAAMVSRR